ncbi:fimbrial protein [Bacteroides sp. 519]|uniref:fimbrial protein n=1 Tax=Bacteroides sp. 519 TaxID=2302937 RepID=UPI0013D7627A|nr:fimbrial protein [Bacteroides sp. 519]
MKQYCKTILLLTLIAMLQGACSKDNLEQNEEPVVILVSAESRADTPNSHEGDPADRNISTLRVLIYESGSQQLAFNIFVPTINNPTKLNIKTGRYNFVFVANEDSDPAIAAQLAAQNPGSKAINLFDMSFAASAFAASKNIPMVTRIDNVLILAYEQYQTPDMQAPETGVWPIWMERLGVRLDIALQMTQSQYDRFSTEKTMRFTNVPDRVYLAPAIISNGTVVAAGVTIPTTDITITPITNPVDEYIWKVQCNRIILPENTFFNKTDATKALKLTLGFGTDDVSEGIICLEPGTDHTLPRNTFLDIDGKVLSTTFTFNTIVQDWTQIDLPNQL